MRDYRHLLVLIFWTSHCHGIILPCKQSLESKVCFLVDNINEYVPTNAPKPSPTLVDSTLNVNDIINVDEEEQTFTLLMKIILTWHDDRVSVNRSQADIDK